MTTNQILIGIGLILVLAVGAQVLASRQLGQFAVSVGVGLAGGVIGTVLLWLLLRRLRLGSGSASCSAPPRNSPR